MPFKLIGLHEKSPYLNTTYASLEASDTKSLNRLKTSVLRSFIMKQLTPDDDTSIFQVFERLNTGGMILQGQEIRNCIYEGEFNNLLKQLNKNDAWSLIKGTKTDDKRMRDLELILRFFALFYNLKSYEKPMKGFLNNFMRTHRRPPQLKKGDSDETVAAIIRKTKAFQTQQKQFEDLFRKTAELVVTYLGAKPFHISKGLNAAVFDSVFTAFAREFGNVENHKPTPIGITRVQGNYHKLLKDKDYFSWISKATADKDVVPKRITLARDILFS